MPGNGDRIPRSYLPSAGSPVMIRHARLKSDTRMVLATLALNAIGRTG